MDLIIRPARQADAPALAAIVTSLGWWKHLTPDRAPRMEAWIRSELDGTSPERTRLVAQEAQGQVLGYIAIHWVPYFFMESREGYITELFLTEEARGQGIGTKLLVRAEEEARSRGCIRLLLHNGHPSDSYKRKFYAKQGWKEWDHVSIFVRQLYQPGEDPDQGSR